MTLTSLAIIFSTLLFCTLFLLKITHTYALKHLIDTPNERSSHSTPTPRGGGIAVALSSITLLLLYGAFQGAQTVTFIIAAACTILTALGFADDHLSLGRRLRFGVTLTTFAVSLWLLPLPNLPLGSTTLSSAWLLYPLLLLSSCWILNLFNFMDGIDGIAGIEIVSVFFGAALTLTLNNEHHWSQLLLLLSAPAIGFLLWNFPPAKIFLGDGGSYFWGGLIVLIAIISAAQTTLNLWCWAILLGAFITDSTWTLTTRILTKQQWNSPHRSHAYQILSRRLNSHRTISLGTGIITLFWLTPLAYFSSQQESNAWLYCFIAYTPLLMTCWACKAGHKELKD